MLTFFSGKKKREKTIISPKCTVNASDEDHNLNLITSSDLTSNHLVLHGEASSFQLSMDGQGSNCGSCCKPLTHVLHPCLKGCTKLFFCSLSCANPARHFCGSETLCSLLGEPARHVLTAISELGLVETLNLEAKLREVKRKKANIYWLKSTYFWANSMLKSAKIKRKNGQNLKPTGFSSVNNHQIVGFLIFV